MRTVRTAAILAALILCIHAHAGDHRHVSGDDPEVGEYYLLQAPQTRLWLLRETPRAGVFSLSKWGLIRVLERDESGGELWFRVKWIKPGTIGDQDDIPGWINSAWLMEHGLVAAD